MTKNNSSHWIEKHKVSFNEVDFSNKIRIDSIFNYLQEAASNSANNLGWGYKDIVNDNLAWVLSRIKLVIERYLSAEDIIMIETWPKGIEGISALRDFKIYDENYEIICYATSSWLLLDRTSMKPLKNNELIDRLNEMDFDKEGIIKDVPPKINISGQKNLVYEKRMFYSDIDVNNHVNNVNIVRLILDSFSKQEFIDNEIKSIQINFSGELKDDDLVSVYRSSSGENGKEIYVEGVKNNLKAFQSLIIRNQRY
jgi:medium-chain acyl-[acyl-carrier-protein] hydrolase